MQKKPLHHTELEYLFEQYADMPNLNRVDFLVPALQEHKARYLHTKDNRKDHVPVDIALVDGAVPSLAEDKKSAFLRMVAGEGLFGSVRALYLPGGEGPAVTHFAGSGRIQAYEPKLKMHRLGAYYELLRRIVKEECGLSGHTVEKVAELSGFSYHMREKLHTVWLDDIHDGSELAAERIREGRSEYMARVRLAGLVYMPPLLGKDFLHFRVRVLRKPTEEKYPINYRSDMGFDYVNVMVRGREEAERTWYEVRQGRPVYLEGELQPSYYAKRYMLENRREVAELLGVDPDSSIMGELDDFFHPKAKADKLWHVRHHLTVWADRLVTDEEAIREEAADGWPGRNKKQEEESLPVAS